jgi:glycosyltransferase involved in cell wall biosynthesis
MTDARPLSILMLAPLAPWPVNSGSKVRMFHLTRALSARHRVTWFSLRTPSQASADVHEHLPHVAVHAAAGPAPGRRARALLRSIWRHEPIHVAEAWSPGAARTLARIGGTFDVVHVFHLTMVQYLPLVRRRLAVYDPMGDESVYMERLSRTAPAAWRPIVRWNVSRVRDYETRATGAFDCVLSVSDVETPRFQRAARTGVNVATVPIAPDTGELLTLPADGGTDSMVLFGGSLDWFPNIDAAQFLATNVWPLVRTRVPAARLVIAGKDPVDDVRRLEALPGVTVVSNPPSMLPLLREASVVTAPIRTGSGIKIKTVEAMAAGKAVVATGLGCEGWDVVDGVHLRRADSAAAFAEAVVDLLSDAPARRRLGTAARRLVAERYTVERMVQRVEEIYRTGLAAAGAA